jgi:hypothetical protein
VVLKDAESLHEKVRPYFLSLGSSKEILSFAIKVAPEKMRHGQS